MLSTLNIGDPSLQLYVPESHKVVLHQGQDLGVELRIAGQHLQGFIDKSETKKDE